MKRILATLLIIYPLLLSAQTVDHFASESSKWFVAESYGNGSPQNPSFIETVTTVYGFNGDTLIGGDTWLKMYSTSDSSFTANLEYEGLIHSENGVVLFQDTANMIDTLYDFNLEVGDSVLYDFYGMVDEYIEVIDADSISINGEMYNRLAFDEPQQPQAFTNLYEYWIDGIGSVHGPLFPHQPRVFSTEFPQSLYLTCSHVNEILYYENEFYDNCVVNIILSNEKMEMVDFTVYPNPSSDQIFVRQPHSNTGSYSVQDMFGKKILFGQLESNNQAVDISELKSGIYFLTITIDSGTLAKQIVKH